MPPPVPPSAQEVKPPNRRYLYRRGRGRARLPGCDDGRLDAPPGSPQAGARVCRLPEVAPAAAVWLSAEGGPKYFYEAAGLTNSASACRLSGGLTHGCTASPLWQSHAGGKCASISSVALLRPNCGYHSAALPWPSLETSARKRVYFSCSFPYPCLTHWKRIE